MSTSSKQAHQRGRKSYHHGDLRRALLREGRRLLDAQGPAALSLREVSRRAGVSQAAPYRHFEGKEALLAALAAEGFRELERFSREAATSHGDPLAALFAVGEGYVRFARENPRIYPLMFGSVRKRRDPEVAAAGDAAFAVLVDAVRACQSAGRIRVGDPRPLALTATSLCHGIASFWLDGRLPDAVAPEDFVRLALGHLVDGVGTGQASRRSQ